MPYIKKAILPLFFAVSALVVHTTAAPVKPEAVFIVFVVIFARYLSFSAKIYLVAYEICAVVYNWHVLLSPLNWE